MYDGREIPGRIIPGPLSAALSGYLGQQVRLFRALAPELSGTAPDPRRFRMTITMTGADAWAEHGWGAQEVSIGEAILRVIAPVPRCVATTRNPDTRN